MIMEKSHYAVIFRKNIYFHFSMHYIHYIMIMKKELFSQLLLSPLRSVYDKKLFSLLLQRSLRHDHDKKYISSFQHHYVHYADIMNKNIFSHCYYVHHNVIITKKKFFFIAATLSTP